MRKRKETLKTSHTVQKQWSFTDFLKMTILNVIGANSYQLKTIVSFNNSS